MAEIDAIARTDTSAGNSLTRGVHHLALTTEDMKRTTEFYVRVIGMPLVHAMTVPPGVGVGPGNRGNPPFEEIRHYFFDMGHDSLLAFFEIPRNEKKPVDRDDIGGMQHVAFTVTVDRFAEIQSRLTEHGVEFDGPVDILPGLQSIYFYDPNGIRLEACCQPASGDAPGVIGSVLQSGATARGELGTLGAGADWTAEMTANLSG
jgi:glyoxylase I family protein